ncbi:SLC13 family permease [Halofilum ochraceum]|uniref:SLC13 family permease n=1 Tax=Halofilum ochraceum TaxID=1611323 RepID=UPI0008D97726|nr:SLC13 family permease [Halofilum ochraceum]
MSAEEENNRATEPAPERRREMNRSPGQLIGLVLGPLLAGGLLLMEPPVGCSPAAWATAGVTVLMATWWVTEALPLPVTALLPVPLLPALGIVDIDAAAAPYANPLVFLFLGGFLLAAGVQQWDLHRRVALAVVSLAGPQPDRLVAGVLGATAVLSMWVSNTATAAMMLPIALALAGLAADESDQDHARRFTVAILLAIAFGANIGGIATLVGTPPNALLAGFLADTHGIEIGFGEWMLVGVPVAGILLALAWWLLARRVFHVGATPLPGVGDYVTAERAALGRLSAAQRRVACVVGLAALGWLMRPLLSAWMPGLALTDAGIGVACALLLFVVPAGALRGPALLDWRGTRGLSWGVLILVGGGLSLGAAIQASGLAEFIAGQLQVTHAWPIPAVVLMIALVTIGLSHVTSNTATTATLLPIAVSLAAAAGQPVVTLAAAVALSASCAFMLPVATPPNAIVFASERLRVVDMIQGGAWLVVGSLAVVTLAAWLLVPLLLA